MLHDAAPATLVLLHRDSVAESQVEPAGIVDRSQSRSDVRSAPPLPDVPNVASVPKLVVALLEAKKVSLAAASAGWAENVGSKTIAPAGSAFNSKTGAPIINQ